MGTDNAKVISVLNFKGGVGKTTTTLNLGAALAKRGKKILLIDIDVQMNTSFVLGYSPNDGESIYELMKGTAQSYPVYDTHEDNLQFIPSSMKLGMLAIEIADRISRETILKRMIAPLLPHYDYILIDCPPGKGVLTDNALCASNSLIIPITCEMMTMQGVAVILSKYSEIKELANPELSIEGFLLIKYNKNFKVGKTVRGILAQEYVPVFNTTIRNSMALNVYCENHQNVFEYDPESTGAKDYMALAEELLYK